MTPKRIGILGGMGPEATVLLMQRVIAATPARDDADHIPLLVDMNPQVPSRIARLIEGRGADPGPVLAEMARRLEAGGATALAMPCNTAHHYAPEIRAAVDVPFIDMVALAVARAAERLGPGGKLGLLGSPALRRIGLFDRACAEAGLTLLHPRDEDALLAAIRAIKAHGPDEDSRAALRAASADLARRGATLQLVACTEFSLIAGALAPEAEGIDTLDLLVAAIRDAALGAPHPEDGTAA
ncbi:aspartate/glutamate racemase family protein [Limimaricola sp. AA108-03]|uniref:aspartate/glutamate racemase family protein n=1 Tax=Limimaricola sp. AA108-03 TaxID=3425945 RepID=UPI003D778EBF